MLTKLLKTISLVCCIGIVCSMLLVNTSRNSIAVALDSSRPFQAILNSEEVKVVEGPQDASEDIPWCDPALFAKPIDGNTIAPPEEKDFPPKPVCKIRTSGTTLPVDEMQAFRNEMLRRYPQLKDIPQIDGATTAQSQLHTSLSQFSLFQPISFSKSGSTIFSRPNGIKKPMVRPLMQAGPIYKYAVLRLSCLTPNNNDCSTSAPGVDSVYFNVSSNPPLLTNGGSWSNLHFYNRVHVGHPSYSSCVFVANQSMGYAYGTVSGTLYNGNFVFELFGSGLCNIYNTGITPTNLGNITMNVVRDSGSSTTWRGYIWIGSWYQAYAWTAPFSTAADMEAGGELWANSGANLNQIILPINMMNKIAITGTNNTGNRKPWHNNVLAAPLNNRGAGQNEAPFSVMDGSGFDRTSIAFHYYH